MKATIDFDDALYRRLKVEAARRGRTVRELVAEGVRYVLDAVLASLKVRLVMQVENRLSAEASPIIVQTPCLFDGCTFDQAVRDGAGDSAAHGGYDARDQSGSGGPVEPSR